MDRNTRLLYHLQYPVPIKSSTKGSTGSKGKQREAKGREAQGAKGSKGKLREAKGREAKGREGKLREGKGREREGKGS